MDKKPKKSSNVLQRNLEEENELKEEDLLERVGKLKSVSLEIRDYMQNEKAQLNKLNRDYDLSNDMIKNTLNRLSILLQTGLGKNTFYLVLVVVFFLFLLYILG